MKTPSDHCLLLTTDFSSWLAGIYIKCDLHFTFYFFARILNNYSETSFSQVFSREVSMYSCKQSSLNQVCIHTMYTYYKAEQIDKAPQQITLMLVHTVLCHVQTQYDCTMSCVKSSAVQTHKFTILQVYYFNS